MDENKSNKEAVSTPEKSVDTDTHTSNPDSASEPSVPSELIDEPQSSDQPRPSDNSQQPSEPSSTPTSDTTSANQALQESTIGQPVQSNQFTESAQPMQPVERLDVPTVADSTVMDGNAGRLKIGMLAAIFGGVFLLLFVGVLIWFFAFYNSAKTIAADAVMNVVTSPNLHIQGSQEITPTNTSSGVGSFSIKTDSASRYYNNVLASSTDVTLSINTSNNQKTDLNFSLILDQNKNIYANINGISDALNQTSSTSYGQQIAPFKDFLTTLEKDWWQIDIRDISSSLGMSEDQQKPLENSYNCVFGSLNTENLKTVGDMYARHQFLSAIQDSEHQAYRMDIDSEQLTDFLNELIHSEMVNQVVTCINDAGKGIVSASSVDNNKNVSADDIAHAVEKMPKIYAQIDMFGHRMTQVSIDDSNSNSSMRTTADYNIEYPAAVEINTPNSYRPASEAIKAFMQMIMQQSVNLNTNSEAIVIETE